MNWARLFLVLLPVLFLVACSGNVEVSEPASQAPSTPGIWPSESPVPTNKFEKPTKSSTEKIPPEDTWNFKIQTSTYAYYAKECWKAGDDTVIKGWWGSVENKWNWHDGYMTFTLEAYGLVKIIPKQDSNVESYLAATMVEPNRILKLYTVQSWEGTDSREIKYKPPKTPWVVNGGYQATSSITSRFTLYVYENKGDIRTGPMPITNRKGITSVICEKGGDNYIVVDATGCKWWIRVGVEP